MLIRFLSVVIRGFCVGTADLVPGVSGGTMAYILGIYDRLIGALQSVVGAGRLLLRGRILAAVKSPDWAFLLPLGLGMVMAILFFTRILSLPGWLESYPEHVYGLFFGMVAASSVLLLIPLMPLRRRDVPYLLLGIIGVMLLLSSPTQQMPDTAPYLFLCGMMAICVMLLPGISGSYLLLLLGKYALVITAVGMLQWTILLPFITGMVAGMLAFAPLLAWLLRRWRHQTLLLLTGLMIGSLPRIWPFQERSYALIEGKKKLLTSTPVLPVLEGTMIWEVGALVIAGMTLVALMHQAGPGQRY